MPTSPVRADKPGGGPATIPFKSMYVALADGNVCAALILSLLIERNDEVAPGRQQPPWLTAKRDDWTWLLSYAYGESATSSALGQLRRKGLIEAKPHGNHGTAYRLRLGEIRRQAKEIKDQGTLPRMPSSWLDGIRRALPDLDERNELDAP